MAEKSQDASRVQSLILPIISALLETQCLKDKLSVAGNSNFSLNSSSHNPPQNQPKKLNCRKHSESVRSIKAANYRKADDKKKASST